MPYFSSSHPQSPKTNFTSSLQGNITPNSPPKIFRRKKKKKSVCFKQFNYFKQFNETRAQFTNECFDLSESKTGTQVTRLCSCSNQKLEILSGSLVWCYLPKRLEHIGALVQNDMKQLDWNFSSFPIIYWKLDFWLKVTFQVQLTSILS